VNPSDGSSEKISSRDVEELPVRRTDWHRRGGARAGRIIAWNRYKLKVESGKVFQCR